MGQSFGRLLFLQVKVDHVFTFGRINAINGVEQLERVSAAENGLFGVEFLLDVNAGFRKKLLRFATGCSTRAVVTPIDLGHGCDYRISQERIQSPR
jgi:hypothetical protein